MDSHLRRQDRSPLCRIWDVKYCRRRDKKAYENECIRLEESLQGGESLTTRFLRKNRTRLHPPDALLFPALRKFLGTVSLNHVHPKSGFVILDDRRDPNGGAHAVRVWDSETYRRHPPEGEDIRTEKLNLIQFLDLLRKKVSICFLVSFNVE